MGPAPHAAKRAACPIPCTRACFRANRTRHSHSEAAQCLVVLSVRAVIQVQINGQTVDRGHRNVGVWEAGRFLHVETNTSNGWQAAEEFGPDVTYGSCKSLKAAPATIYHAWETAQGRTRVAYGPRESLEPYGHPEANCHFFNDEVRLLHAHC